MSYIFFFINLFPLRYIPKVPGTWHFRCTILPQQDDNYIQLYGVSWSIRGRIGNSSPQKFFVILGENLDLSGPLLSETIWVFHSPPHSVYCSFLVPCNLFWRLEPKTHRISYKTTVIPRWRGHRGWVNSCKASWKSLSRAITWIFLLNNFTRGRDGIPSCHPLSINVAAKQLCLIYTA